MCVCVCVCVSVSGHQLKIILMVVISVRWSLWTTMPTVSTRSVFFIFPHHTASTTKGEQCFCTDSQVRNGAGRAVGWCENELGPPLSLPALFPRASPAGGAADEFAFGEGKVGGVRWSCRSSPGFFILTCGQKGARYHVCQMGCVCACVCVCVCGCMCVCMCVCVCVCVCVAMHGGLIGKERANNLVQ